MSGIIETLGYRIIEDSNLLKFTDVPRTWHERLLTWPWRPWKKTKRVSLPDPDFYGVGNDIVCHPVTAQRLRRVMAEHDKAVRPKQWT